MGYDGWVIVGTKLDSKQLERDLKQAERRLQQYEKEAEKLTKAKAKAEIDLQPYEEQKKLIQEMTDESLQYAQTQQEVEQMLEIEKTQMEELNQKYSKQLANIEEINNKIQENTKNQGLMKNEIEETGNKLKQAKMKDGIEDIGNSISKTIKKVAKWTLAIFSVRTAYNAIRNALSTITQQDEQLATDIEYMKNALAYTIEPLIRGIVNLAKQLLLYVGYIVNKWTGKNIFENANKSLAGANKQAKNLSKTLAGFDEMNVISDTSAGGVGVGTPSFDLSNIEDVEVPSWIQWIADNKDIVIGALLAIGTAIGLIKLVDLIGGLSKLWNVLQPIITFIGTNATVIGGIILIIGGLAIAIQGLINYLKDPTWENFGNMLLGIGIIAGGVLLIFGGFPALIALIVGAIVALGVAIYKNWDKIVAFTKELVQKIKDAFGIAINWIKEKFNSLVSFFSNLISKIVNLFKNIGTKVGDGISSAFKTVVNGVLKAIENILNFPIKSINKLIDVINKVPGINIGTLPTFSLPRLAVGGVVNMPGRGVMVGGAITGERGAEGVIPLTNSQMMAQLGEAIGKYVTINANITNTMNGRVISRELQKVNNNSDFAFNR